MVKKRAKYKHGGKQKGKEICNISVQDKVKKGYDSCSNILPQEITHKVINDHWKTQRDHLSQDKMRNIQIPWKKKIFQEHEELQVTSVKQQLKPVYFKKNKIEIANEKKKTQNNSAIGLTKKLKKKENQRPKKKIMPKKLRLTYPHENQLKEIRFLINQSSQLIEDSKQDTKRSQENKKIQIKESVKKNIHKKHQKLDLQKYEEAAIKIQNFWRGVLTQKLLESNFNQRKSLSSFNNETEQMCIVNSQRNQQKNNQLIYIDFPDLQEINFQSSNIKNPNKIETEQNEQIKSEPNLMNLECRIDKDQSELKEEEQKYMEQEQQHIFRHHRQIFSKEQLKINNCQQENSSEQQVQDNQNIYYMPNSIIVQTHQEYLDSRKSSILKSKIGSNQQSQLSSNKQIKNQPQEDIFNKKNSLDKQGNNYDPFEQIEIKLEEKKRETNYQQNQNIRKNQQMYLKKRKYRFQQESQQELQLMQKKQQVLFNLNEKGAAQNLIPKNEYYQQKNKASLTETNQTFEKNIKNLLEDMKEMEIKKWKKIEVSIVEELNKPLLRRSPEQLLKTILQDSRQTVLQLEKIESIRKLQERKLQNSKGEQEYVLAQQKIKETNSQQKKKKKLKLQLDIIDKGNEEEIVKCHKGSQFKKIIKNKINNLPQEKEIYQLFKAGFAVIKEKENNKLKLLEKEFSEGKISPKSFMNKKIQLEHQYFQEKELMNEAKLDIEKGIKYAAENLLSSNLRQLKYYFPHRSFSSNQKSFLKILKGVKQDSPSISPRFDKFQNEMLKIFPKNFKQMKKLEKQQNCEVIKLWDKQFQTKNNNIIISDPFLMKDNVEKEFMTYFQFDQINDIKLQIPHEKIELLQNFVFAQILKEIIEQLFFSKIFIFIQKLQYFTPINLPTTTLQDQYLARYLNHLIDILPNKKILMEKINQKMGPTPQEILKGMRQDDDYQTGDYEVVLNHDVFLKSTEFIKKLPKFCEFCEEWPIKGWDQNMINFYKKRSIELKNRKEKLINLTLDMETIYFKSVFDALNQKIIDIKLIKGLNGRIIGMSQLSITTTDMNKIISLAQMKNIIKEAKNKVQFYMNLKIIGDFEELNPIMQRQANKIIIKMLKQQIEQNQARWLNRMDQILQISLQITQFIQESLVNDFIGEILSNIYNIQQ